MRRLAAAFLLAFVLLFASATVASPQQAEETDVEATDESNDDESASNVVPLLIGGVLLGAGIWAYMNKNQRFPGTRFRD